MLLRREKVLHLASFTSALLLFCAAPSTSMRKSHNFSERHWCLSVTPFQATSHLMPPFQATNSKAFSDDMLPRYCCYKNITDMQHGNNFLMKCWNQALPSTLPAQRKKTLYGY